jgi:hypothetical protein
MHLIRLIFLLLQTTLFWITFEAYATPLTREQSGLIKLPLRRRNPIRRELHPQMVSTVPHTTYLEFTIILRISFYKDTSIARIVASPA